MTLFNKIHPRLKSFFPILLLASQIPFLLLYLKQLVFKLHHYCPNNDFLGWDANLRLVTTLKMITHLRDYNFPSFFLMILDSPTWPVLRNIVEAVLFLFITPGALNEIYFTIFTLLLLFIITATIVYHSSNGNLLTLAITFFIFWTSVFQSQPLMLYTFSGMLEIQGGVFFLSSIYLFYILLNDNSTHRKKSLLILFFLSVQFLYHTKYPYGYMFTLSITIIYIHIRPAMFIQFLKEYFICLRNNRFMPLFLILTLSLIYLFIPPALKSGKGLQYLKYIYFLILTTDLTIFYIKKKDVIANIDEGKLADIFLAAILPIILWTAIHPDRFGSSSGTISHIQAEGQLPGVISEKNLDYYLFYSRELQGIFFDSAYSILLIILGLLIFINGLFKFYLKKEINTGFIISSSILLQIVFLTFLTGNHQARHIYHLYPALILLPFFLIKDRLRACPQKNLPIWALLCGLIFFSVVFFTEKKNWLYEKTHICFSGVNTDPFKLPRWLKANEVEFLRNNTVIYNLINPIHVNKSDAEMIISLDAYKQNLNIQFDPGKYARLNKNIQNLVFIGNNCNIKNHIPLIHKSLLQKNPTFIKEIKGEGCILTYQLNQ